LLLRRYGSQLDPDAIQYIEYAVTGALRIENLLKALREYWHISEVTERQPVWTDCNSVVDHALQNLEGTIREVDAIITRDALPTVLADQTPLLQLFQNLIGNALKYRHPDRRPAVHIRATAGVGEWVFSVRDNGIGIDPQYAKQVFGLFKRLNGYRYGGAGMGLAICQKIAERFGGRIWVDSQLGEGASFYFTIPTNIERQVDTTSGDGQATRPAPAAGSHR
jgi:light-regulated signal transduction histidine kinase (bacteriophytochrome)